MPFEPLNALFVTTSLYGSDNELQNLTVIGESGKSVGFGLFGITQLVPEPSPVPGYPEEFLLSISTAFNVQQVNAAGESLRGVVQKIMDLTVVVGSPTIASKTYTVTILKQNTGTNIPTATGATLTVYIANDTTFASLDVSTVPLPQ